MGHILESESKISMASQSLLLYVPLLGLDSFTLKDTCRRTRYGTIQWQLANRRMESTIMLEHKDMQMRSRGQAIIIGCLIITLPSWGVLLLQWAAQHAELGSAKQAS